MRLTNHETHHLSYSPARSEWIRRVWPTCHTHTGELSQHGTENCVGINGVESFQHDLESRLLVGLALGGQLTYMK